MHEKSVLEPALEKPEPPALSLEQQIGALIERMRKAIGGKTPHFKEYWDARGQCLPLFRKNVPVAVRAQLWEEYTLVSSEARYLKETLDKESIFVIEQVELAIAAIEEDLEKIEERIAASSPIHFPILQRKASFYENLQKHLNFLNGQGVRISSLRKEVIKTEMRSRLKNQLLEKLSLLGDKVFPKRKELMGQISSEFLSDVKAFSKETERMQEYRREIRAFQQMAKELTLDTPTFTETRLELSRLWDLSKEQEVQRKQQFAEKREIFEKNKSAVLDKIKLFAERCQKETWTDEEASKQSKEILGLMKTMELGKEDVFDLKEALAKARAPIDERAMKKQEARERDLEVAQKQRQDKIDQFRNLLQEATKLVEEKAVEELLQMKEKLHQKLLQLVLTHAQRELLEHELKVFRDLIIDKKETAISTLTLEQKESLDHQRALLKEWQVQKNEIQNQLKTYRKALAGSGLDFEKAMRLKELVDVENGRLDKVNGAIEEVEEQIDILEGG